MKHPYLIIISQEIPHSKAAGSIQLLRLLEQWPTDRLVVYGPPTPSRAETLDCAYYQFQPKIHRVQYTRLAPLAPPLSWLLPLRPPDVVLSAPSVVLSVMQSSAYYRAAGTFARRNQVPLALIIHDDPEEIEPVRWYSRALMRKFNRQIYRSAAVRFCISPQMRDVLSARYGASGDVLYPIRSRITAPRAEKLNRTLRRKDGLVVGYAGSMVYGYGPKLEQLLPMFRHCGATLRIYSLQTPCFIREAGVEYAGALGPEAVSEKVQQECDAVILPYAGADLGYQQLYRTHFPSKLPDYLALGMPVIITGPIDASGVKWGLAHPYACLVICSDETNEWEAALSRLRTDPDYRVLLATGALRAAQDEFDPDRLERLFLSRLRDVALNEQVISYLAPANAVIEPEKRF